MAEIRGSHVLAFTVTAFGLVVGVNVLMAWKAVSTFPGLEVDNSYVASQEFNRLRAAQDGLGWTLAHRYRDGRLVLAFADREGNPVEVRDLAVLVGRTTEARDDIAPQFAWLGDRYEATLPLARGRWMIRVEARAADGTLFRQRDEFSVTGPG